MSQALIIDMDLESSLVFSHLEDFHDHLLDMKDVSSQPQEAVVSASSSNQSVDNMKLPYHRQTTIQCFQVRAIPVLIPVLKKIVTSSGTKGKKNALCVAKIDVPSPKGLYFKHLYPKYATIYKLNSVG